MTNTFVDENESAIPILPGNYPAHVSTLESKDVTTKFGDKKVFNIGFRIAEQVVSMKMVKHEYVDNELVPIIENGKEVEIDGSFMKDKTFTSTGLWLTENPPVERAWENKGYLKFFQSMGIVFPQAEDGRTQLAEVEEEDIIGLPVYVKLDKEEYTNKDGEERTAWRVFSVKQWKDGQRLSSEEMGDDVPF